MPYIAPQPRRSPVMLALEELEREEAKAARKAKKLAVVEGEPAKKSAKPSRAKGGKTKGA